MRAPRVLARRMISTENREEICDDQVLGGIGPAAEAEAGRHHAFVHDGSLGHRVILAVIHDRQIKHPGVFHRTPHQIVRLHAIAVIGDRNNARPLERTDGSERLPFHSDGDAPGGIDADNRVTGDDILHQLDRPGIIRDRRRIGHAHDGGESARGGGLRAGGHRLLVRLTGLPEMDVDIHQAGTGDLAGRVDLPGPLASGEGKGVDDEPVNHEEIAHRVAFGGGIDHTGVAYPESGHGRGLVGGRHEFGLTPGTKIEDGHADGDAIGHLLQNHAARSIGELTVDFHAAVDGTRVHDDRLGIQPGGARLVQTKHARVLTERGEQPGGLTFMLDPQ